MRQIIIVAIILFSHSSSISQESTFTDSRDGQTYSTVSIGTQTWFAENLNYEAGNSWCYQDSVECCAIYGRLYDWQTALVACPLGWHLPSEEEWNELISYLGGKDEAGGRMKEIGQKRWSSPSEEDANNSGFVGLGAGFRNSADEKSRGRSDYAFWWSSAETSYFTSWSVGLHYSHSRVNKIEHGKDQGFSCRCLK